MWRPAVRSLAAVVPAIWLCTASARLAPASGPEAPVDVLAYRISLDLGPEAPSLRAATAITLLVTKDGLDAARFDFAGLEVDSVKVEGGRAPFARDAESLEVQLGRRSAGDTVTVEVYYGGTPENGLYFVRDEHGLTAVFADNWPNRAHYWFPAIDHPGDKATVEFRVRAPQEWAVVANGRLIAEELLEDGGKLTVWATDQPIPVYTMVIGAADMSVSEVGAVGCEEGAGPCVLITQWVYPEDEERAFRLFREAPEIVAFFDSLIGPFPYDKLALVESTTRFGGMENSSAIFFPERAVRVGAGSGLVAHEIAHQWFGDAVTEREWPHIWLSEGFATYFASVFFEFTTGDTVAARVRANAEQRYLSSQRDVARPVIDAEPADLFDLLNSNSYQKGAWVLHMLRQVVGDEAFFEGIRRYYAGYVHGTALTADLRRIMEETSGQELSWFFEQWLWRPGYPQVEVRPSWDAGSKSLLLRVLQTQPWEPFRFLLEIEVEGEGYGLARTFWIEDRESDYTWSLPGKPDRIAADPKNSLLGPARVVR